VPYVDTREAVAQSAALSPDGETFYTYANNTLTHWSLSPVKVLESVKIEDLDIVNGKWHRIYVTPDQQKIIFVTTKVLILYNLEQKAVTKKINLLGAVANMIDSNFLFVKKMMVYKLNPNTLEINSLAYDLRYKADFEDSAYFILDSDNKEFFTIITHKQFIVVNRKTFQIVRRFNADNSGPFFISMDGRYFKSELVFDLKRQELKDDLRKELKKHEIWYSISIFSDTLLMRDKENSCLTFYNRKHDIARGLFYQLMDGNWIILTTNGFFNSSSKARKYLYMKTLSGESAPIDDATYDKFHTQINLKD
jgi:hypothetical protein